MKKLVGFITVAFVGLNIGLPAQAIGTTGQDIVCGYKYKVGDSGWTNGTTGGTTRQNARLSREQMLSNLESEAADSGESFDVTYLGCRDPYGHN
ncbi:MAG: hypothetical protein VKK42_30980 [Lyngbya sp.]|nr:hypothetical protein [Lyngbya sp.]